MASEETLKELGEYQADRRRADHLDRERRSIYLSHGSAEEKLRKMTEMFEEERNARIEAEKKFKKLQSQLEKGNRSVTPTNKGTSDSGCKLSIASRVFRDQLIDIF